MQRKLNGEAVETYQPANQYIAPVPAPAKHDLVAKHRTHFDRA